MFKHIYCLFIPLFALFAGSFAIDPGNENIIKTYQKKEIGNGVTLNQIFDNFDGKNVCRGFRINVKEDGKFFVSAWAQGLAETTWKVYVDGSPFETGCLGLQKDGWQAGKVGHSNDKKTYKALKLASGDHTIVFSGKGPDYPDVESLKFGKTEDEAFIDEEPFQKNLEKIMNNPDGSANLPGNNASSLETTSASTPLTAPDEPYYDYDYRYGAFRYTFRETYYFSSGTSVKFEVKNATKPYILYFFKTNGTEMFTYVVTSQTGSNKSITKTIPFTGVYMVMIRAYNPSNPGICNLYYNNNLNQSGCIIAGNIFWGSLTKTGTLNYFAANPEGSGYDKDSYIFLVTDINYPVATFNDDFGQPGDFDWGFLSRKQFDFTGWSNPNNTVGLIASTYWSADNYDGYCYMMNKNETTILSQF